MTAAAVAKTPSKAKRRTARHARLSNDAIIEAALEMLEQSPLEAFSLNRLAARLGAGVMSLYTYFPSRDALLVALADAIFARFEAPEPGGRWQDVVQDWLWATVRHLDRYPVALKLGIWDGHVSPAWLHIWLPLAARLQKEGLDGRDLAFAMNWFTTAAMGFITAQMHSPDNRQERALAHVGALEGEEQRLAATLWFDFKGLDRDAALAFGFWQIIKGLETILAARTRNPPA